MRKIKCVFDQLLNATLFGISSILIMACGRSSDFVHHDLAATANLYSSTSNLSDQPGIPTDAANDYNNFVLQAIASMPTGGGYSISPVAFRALKGAITIDAGGQLNVETKSIPSFCSGATYLVFIKTLSLLKSQIKWPRSLLMAMLVHGQIDGEGAWGRWNANGPGTARLFFETGLGTNFDDWAEAKPGDFLKIWWTQKVGKSEHGHSVIYMGSKAANGTTFVGIWSANTSNPDGTSGMGLKWYPKSKIARVVFSRLKNIKSLININSLPTIDTYLSQMLKRDSSVAEMNEKIGLH
jgi:hypothetical protein